MTVEMPPRIKALPVDSRGYPIPVIVLRDKTSKPHFSINDDETVRSVLTLHQCGICGQDLDEYWLVGGPQSAFDKRGAYLDPPVHRECAVYALQVCPYLAAPKYSRRVDGATLDPKNTPDNVIGVTDSTMDPNRPKVFVLIQAKDVNVWEQGIQRFCIPTRPILRSEFWINSQRMGYHRAKWLIDQDFPGLLENRRRA